MPISTLAELFAAGGQHTVEQVIEQSGFSFAGITDALRRRFGPDLTVSDASIEQFAFQVREGMAAARQLNQGGPLNLDLVPAVAGAKSGYTYTVMVSVPDPLRPDDDSRREEVPLTINDPNPLDIEQVRRQVEGMLADWEPPRDTIPGGPAADLIRRDIIIRSRMDDFGGRAAGIVTTDAVAVYRGR